MDLATQYRMAVLWQHAPQSGWLEVINGALAEARVAAGAGRAQGAQVVFDTAEAGRLDIAVEAPPAAGARPVLVTVRGGDHPFTFFARDVDRRHPIFIPDYGVAVTEAGDTRSYDQIEAAVRSLGGSTALQAIARDAEESFDQAARQTRCQHVPTWLGLSRDMRLFELDYDTRFGYWGTALPRFHGYRVSLPELNGADASFDFSIGRGASCVVDITRQLDMGCLPILLSTANDGDVAYQVTAFATLERSPLTAATLRGTHFLVADGHGHGHMFTDEQRRAYEALLPEELEQDEETVLCLRAEAVNTAAVPRYAWFRTATMPGWSPMPRAATRFDGATGCSSFASSGRVYAVSRLNGRPLPQEEIAVLLQPGECAVFEMLLPHRPVPPARAAPLGRLDFDARLDECRRFWLDKLAQGARLELPEARLDEMARAGLLHLDLVAYGREPGGPLAATIGVYCPIGSESAPIIQFFDSMGWHDVARRSLQYFLDKQHDDGFIQNFGGYMLETGSALWTLGEHYRYTRDDAWARQAAPQVVKACDFLLRWRERNQHESLRGKGYGLIEGKVGDPEDPYRQFMLNGYACLGLARAAEMLAAAGVAEARPERLAAEAQAWKADIRTALFEALARSPAVPMGDGAWCPTVPPWAEYRGPVALQADGGNWFTHGAVACRDSLVGPLYLIFQEVVAPDEPVAGQMLDFHSELFCVRNVAFSQPYYSRHPEAHLRRGEVKAFLKAYYNLVAGLADRETYSFWEHYFQASPHKTHEEGWFLMQTRWMLYQEDGRSLRLLPGIPRAWLEDGNTIALDHAASYFGPLSVRVESHLRDRCITARLACPPERRPDTVLLRLPHPQGRRASAATGGWYNPETETVVVSHFPGNAEVILRF